MDYFQDNARLYEISVLSDAQSDDYVIECFDMSPDGPGLVGTLRVDPAGRGTLALQAPVTVRLLRKWLEIAGSETGLDTGDT